MDCLNACVNITMKLYTIHTRLSEQHELYIVGTCSDKPKVWIIEDNIFSSYIAVMMVNFNVLSLRKMFAQEGVMDG